MKLFLFSKVSTLTLGPTQLPWVLEYVKWLVHVADSLSAILLRLRVGGAIPPFRYVFHGMMLKKTQGLSDFLFILIDC